MNKKNYQTLLEKNKKQYQIMKKYILDIEGTIIKEYPELVTITARVNDKLNDYVLCLNPDTKKYYIRIIPQPEQ